MCKITARYADGWLPFSMNVEDYKRRLGIIEEECNRIGRKFDEIERGLYLNLIIDESREECLRIMQAPLIKAGALLVPANTYKNLGHNHPLGETFYPLTDYIPAKLSRDEAIKAIESVPQEVVQENFLWGNVEDVIEKLDRYRKVGAQTVAFWNFTFLGDVSKVKSSYACVDQLVNYFREED